MTHSRAFRHLVQDNFRKPTTPAPGAENFFVAEDAHASLAPAVGRVLRPRRTGSLTGSLSARRAAPVEPPVLLSAF